MLSCTGNGPNGGNGGLKRTCAKDATVCFAAQRVIIIINKDYFNCVLNYWKESLGVSQCHVTRIWPGISIHHGAIERYRPLKSRGMESESASLLLVILFAYCNILPLGILLLCLPMRVHFDFIVIVGVSLGL
jgi:hypothetical protein